MTNDPVMHACLLGGALGDSIGLPLEGMGAGRIARLRKGRLAQNLVFGRGMVSDDSEHAVMTLLSMDEATEDVDGFTRALAGRLRWWLAGLPAGIGLGTARSILKLWLGVSPKRSGSSSAGNGPMMRAAVIGVRFKDDPVLRREFVDASTLVTHRDARALEAGRLIAECAAMAAERKAVAEIVARLSPMVESDEMKLRFGLMRECLGKGMSVGYFADSFGRKKGSVSGFAPDTAAVAIFAWLENRNDFRKAIEETVAAGGDTDTVGFVVGSLVGIEVGVEGMPVEWREGLWDFPITGSWLGRLAAGQGLYFPNFPFSLPRNILFLGIVLCHGFRRLFPPY